MHRRVAAIAFALLLVACGCAPRFEALRATEWYATHAARVEAARQQPDPLDLHADAIVVGTVVATPVFEGDGTRVWVELGDARLVVSTRGVESTERFGLSLARDVCTGDPPRAGERWAFDAHRNAKGIWDARSAVPVPDGE